MQLPTTDIFLKIVESGKRRTTASDEVDHQGDNTIGAYFVQIPQQLRNIYARGVDSRHMTSTPVRLQP